LRAEGKVPCVLYGGNEQVHFSAPALDFRHLVYTPEVYTVDIHVNGKTYSAIMKDIQFHPVTDSLMHIDFMELSGDKPVNMEIPVKVSGNSVGVRAGGILVHKLRKLKISALPKHLPDQIEVKIDDLNIGDDVRVKDLHLDGVTFLDTPSNVIAGVKTTRAVAAAAPAEAAPAKAAPAAAAPAAKK
ncbi:MAG: 50S ribosomal protein L25/general stress protein Ctc, partial [Bacteroidota bacterium]